MPILPRRRYAEPLLLLLLAAVARSTAAAPDVVELILLTGAQEKGAGIVNYWFLMLETKAIIVVCRHLHQVSC
jgi:hypothetical protein